MIIKGNRHSNGPKLAAYLMNGGKHGERVEAPELRGFGPYSDDIFKAFRSLHVMADATGIENPLFHVQVRLPDHEQITREQWEQTADRIQHRLGLDGQARAVVFHIDEQTGERHMHLAFSLIDAETLKAKELPFFKMRMKTLARELEKEFDITRVTNERKGPIQYAAKKNEQQQAQRLETDKDEIRNTIRACWDQSDCGRSFEGALAHEGMILAQGDQRGLVVVDHAGGVHALGKRILDVNKKAILDRLADLDLNELPTVQQAQSSIREVKAEQRQEKQPNWNRDRANQSWEDAVINAAIEQEKTARQFVDPKPEKETRAGRLPKEPPPRPAKGPAADIWTAMERSDSPRAFAAALQEKGMDLAAATEEEANRSRIAAAYPKAIGNFMPEYRPGEIVAVTERGQVYQLNRRTTGKERDEIEAFLAPLDRSQLQDIEATKQSQQQRVNEKHWPTMPPPPQPVKTSPALHFEDAARAAAQPEPAPAMPDNLKGPAAHIWTAYNVRVHMQERERKDPSGKIEKYQVPIAVKGGRDPYQFGQALEQKGMALARVTKDEAERSRTEADHWKKHGEYRPTYREGEFVAITQRGDVYSLNKRTTGQDAKHVQSFLEKADWKGLYGMEATKEIMQTRAEQRASERHASRDEFAASRLDRATKINLRARGQLANDIKGPARAALDKAALGAIGKPIEFLSNAFESLLSPKLTPQQKHEGELARRDREADAETTIDFSKYTADRAQEGQHHQEQQSARDRQRELERDR